MNITLVKHKKSRKDQAAEHVCKGAVSSSAIRQRKLKEVFQRDLLRSLSGAVIFVPPGEHSLPCREWPGKSVAIYSRPQAHRCKLHCSRGR